MNHDSYCHIQPNLNSETLNENQHKLLTKFKCKLNKWKLLPSLNKFKLEKCNEKQYQIQPNLKHKIFDDDY